MFGYFSRASCIMQTITELRGFQHVQSIVGCNRTLLEILVDMILVHYDTTGESDTMLPLWEESAKLKHCQATVTYYRDRKRAPIPGHYRVREDFTNSDAQRIELQRDATWGSTKHPNRWTGAGNLLEDIRKADNLHSISFKGSMLSSLEEYYETEYRPMCWNVHGSAFTAMRNIPKDTVIGLCAFAWSSCADIAMECNKMILKDYGFEQALPSLQEEWGSIDFNRNRLILDCVSGQERRE